jgi:hypothetical protein
VGVSALAVDFTTDTSNVVYSGPATASLLGDGDADGDIDLNDFVLLEGCLDGPNTTVTAPCPLFDFEADGDVDALDFAEFNLAFGT